MMHLFSFCHAAQCTQDADIIGERLTPMGFSHYAKIQKVTQELVNPAETYRVLGMIKPEFNQIRQNASEMRA